MCNVTDRVNGSAADAAPKSNTPVGERHRLRFPQCSGGEGDVQRFLVLWRGAVTGPGGPVAADCASGLDRPSVAGCFSGLLLERPSEFGSDAAP